MPLIRALDALTRKKWIPELTDNFFNSTPFLAKLREKQKIWDGGTFIEVPIIHDRMANVSSFSGFDEITRDEGEHKSAAMFTPKFVLAPVTVAKTDIWQNMKPQQVIDIAKARLEVAMLTMREEMTEQLFSDGTGNMGKDIDGLEALFDNTAIYGGIDRNIDLFWHAQVFENGGNARPLTVRLMRQAFVAASDGQDKPDLIITTDALWAQYAEIGGAQAQVVTRNTQKMLDLGFEVLNFMGAPVVPDKACPAGLMYFLNTRWLILYVLKTVDMKTEGWRDSEGQKALINEIVWGGNLVCRQPRRQAVIRDLDESNYKV